MAKFSAGQKVVCIDASHAWSELIVGEAYEVVRKGSYYEDNGYVSVSGVDSSWDEERFELYEDKTETMNNTKKPHIHAQMIIAWASGEAIEFSEKGKEYWNAVDFPSWSVALDYRIKLEPTYPKTSMHHKNIREIYNNSIVHGDAITAIANEAIKHFITSGDMNKYLESLK
jgi:hypothetical protein